MTARHASGSRSRLRVPDAVRDPSAQSVIVLVLLALIGFAMLALAWRGGARTVYVPLQMPWLVSGGLAGLGLLGMALGAVSIHLSRRDDAAHRAEIEGLVRDAAELAEQVRTGVKQLPRR